MPDLRFHVLRIVGDDPAAVELVDSFTNANDAFRAAEFAQQNDRTSGSEYLVKEGSPHLEEPD